MFEFTGINLLLALSASWCYAVRYGKSITDRVPGCMDQFQMDKYSSVSSMIGRMNAAIAGDRRLRKQVEKLISNLK